MGESVSTDEVSSSSDTPGESSGSPAAASGQATGSVPLAPEAPKAAVGEVVQDGLVYQIEGEVAALVGWRGSAPAGDVVVPARVTSGADSYVVARIGVPDADGKPVGVLAGSSAESLSLPETIEAISDGALSGCPSLQRVLVSSKNEAFASFDGMLFTKDLQSLLSIPEGKGGVARIPDQTSAVPASALSQCVKLSCILVGEGSTTFASRNGVLYSKDMKTLIACPPGAAGAVVVPESVEAVAAGAFAGCEVTSIAALGNMREIAADAFDDAAKSAVVALPAGEGYDARKAVWEAAGFSEFAEPAKPGDAAGPAEPEGSEGSGAEVSGLAYTLLDDYTLSVAWTGSEDPAADLEVPASAELNGVSYRVSAIAPQAFEGRASLCSVKLPASVASIGEAAFANCSNLSDVDLPEGLRAIGASAFEAAALADLWLPASLQSVGSRALAGCASLQRVVALGSPEVAADALAGCAGVAVYCPSASAANWNVGLPAAGNHLMPCGVELAEAPLALEAGQSASLFDGGSLEAPDGVQASFAYSAKPLSVDQDGLVSAKAEGASEVSVALTLDGVELARATRAVQVSAPETDASAENQEAVDGASGHPVFSQVVSLMAAEPQTPAQATEDASAYPTLVFTQLDGQIQTCDVRANPENKPAGDLVIPEKVLIEGVEHAVTQVWGGQPDSFEGGFANCEELTSVVLPDSLIEIGNYAFFNDRALTTAQLNEGLQTIRNSAFHNCYALDHASIPASTTLVEEKAFYAAGLRYFEVAPGNSNYSSQGGSLLGENGTLLMMHPNGDPNTVYHLPDQVTKVSPYAFADEQSLVGFEVSASHPTYAAIDGVLFTKDKATLVKYPSNKPDEAYAIPAGTQIVGSQSFRRVLNLKQVTFAQSVHTIESSAFAYSESIETARLNKVKTIETSAFSNNSNLRELDLGDAVETIGREAFAYAASLKEITLPESVKVVCWGAFGSNTVLETIWASSYPETFENAFAWSRLQETNVCITGAGKTDAELQAIVEFWSTKPGEDIWPDDCGFKRVFVTNGSLPTVNGQGSASWRVDPATFTLYIESEGTGTVVDVLWPDVSSEVTRAGFWGSARPWIQRVEMDPSLLAVDMSAWFREMSSLKSMDGIFIPKGCANVHDLFCLSGLESIREGFVVPEGVEDAASLFHTCRNLASVPEGFSLPSTVKDVSCLFKNTSIASVPDSLSIPEGAVNVAQMFSGCTNLSVLPDAFTVPDGATDAMAMFAYCTSLQSLPADFRIPATVKNLREMFVGCSHLSTLPEGFLVPSDSAATDAGDFHRMFGGCTDLTVLPQSFALPSAAVTNSDNLFHCDVPRTLYYPGEDPVMLTAGAEWWRFQNRTLVTPADGQVTFRLSPHPGSSTWIDRERCAPDEAGLVAEPAAPARSGQVFSLWYADEACTKPYDFTKPVSEQAAYDDESQRFYVYGKYVDGTLGGFVPTVGNKGSAWWSLADDGTLYLRANGKLDALGWDDNADLLAGNIPQTGYWAPYRSLVKKAVMAPGMKASTAANWFSGMESLTDASATYVPAEAASTSRMYSKSAALEALPDGFGIPGTVTQAISMFDGCKAFAQLPAGFGLPGSLARTDGMFRDSGLTALPEGFVIPGTVRSIDSMFENCPALTSLPASFAVPSQLAGAQNVFACLADPSQPRIVTYYDGTDSVVRGFDWESWGRTLVTDAADAEGFGMQQAVFKVQSATPDASGSHQWETRSTAWTDKQGILANPGEPRLEGYEFSGWCVDKDCLRPFDFSKPLTERTVLYGTWLVAGGRSATLPLAAESPAGSQVWWRLTADGTLSIKGSGTVASLGFNWSPEMETAVHWAPYRGKVESVVMDEDVKAQNMRAWFCRMPELADVSRAFVPQGTDSVSDLFYDCPKLAEVPDGFVLPDSVLTVNSMFHGCVSLRQLPQGFTVPKNAASASSMFKGCISLETLPEGFAVPSSLVGASMSGMFVECNRLAMLPDSFDFPLAAAHSSTDPFLCSAMTDTYYAGESAAVAAYDWASQNRSIVSSVPAGKVLVEFNLPAEGSTVEGQGIWTRRLADPGAVFEAPAAPARAGLGFVGWFSDAACEAPYDFSKTPAENGVEEGGTLSLYGKYTEMRGTLPTTDGGQNAAWELTADGTLRIWCEKPGAVVQDLKWDELKWENDPDSIAIGYWAPLRTQVKTVVMDERLQAESVANWFYGMKSLVDVEKVFVPSQAKSVRSMFQACASLASLPEGFTIPEGVENVRALFRKCSSLRTLPSSFAIPSTVNDMFVMFEMSGIEVLPEDFTINESVTDPGWMFNGCRNLKSLPTGFKIPSNATSVAGMFMDCVSLTSLPEGVLIPESATDAAWMFKGCTSLTALPQGFTIPKNVNNTTNMFLDCIALSALPEGFAIEGPATLATVVDMFANCPSLVSLPSSFSLEGLANAKGVERIFRTPTHTAAAPLTTYYAGDDAARLNPAGGGADAAVSYWQETYKRRLVAGTAPSGSFKVEYRLQKPAQADASSWMTRIVWPDGNGAAYLADQVAPSLFGYAFAGWTDAATGRPFDFSQPITGDTVLTGSYTLVLDVDVPLVAKVEIDASGNVAEAPFDVASRTPVKVAFSQVTSAEAPGASKLVPRAEDLAKVTLDVKVGESAPSPVPVVGGTAGPFEPLPAAKPGAPSALEGSIGLSLNGAQIDFQPGEDITSLAKLTWTVEAVG